jgi:hypothetical protein
VAIGFLQADAMAARLCDSLNRLRGMTEARKHFFFEKKKQKTFVRLVDAADKTSTYLIE